MSPGVVVCPCAVVSCVPVVVCPCGWACKGCAPSCVCPRATVPHAHVRLCPVSVWLCGGCVRVCIYKWVCHTPMSDGASACACAFTRSCAECARLRAVVHPRARVARLCVAVHLHAVVARPRAIPPVLVSRIGVQLCIRVWHLCAVAHAGVRVKELLRVIPRARVVRGRASPCGCAPCGCAPTCNRHASTPGCGCAPTDICTPTCKCVSRLCLCVGVRPRVVVCTVSACASAAHACGSAHVGVWLCPV